MYYVYVNPQFLIYTPVPLWQLLSLSSMSVSLFLFCLSLNVLCTIQRTFALLLTFKSYWGYILFKGYISFIKLPVSIFCL